MDWDCPCPGLCELLGRHIHGGLYDRWMDSPKYRRSWCQRAGVDVSVAEKVCPPDDSPKSKRAHPRIIQGTKVEKPEENGVGTSLKHLIQERYGIGTTSSCQCDDRAAEMNRRGIAWCERNQETIIGWLMEGAAERVWLRPLVAILNTQAKQAARRLVADAIEAAKNDDPLYVKFLEWQEPIRKNLMFHVWPANPEVWRWNLDRMLQSIDQFDGHRILGIVTDENTEPQSVVKDYVKGHGFQFVERENRPRLREVVTFPSMLKMVQSLDPNEVTFSGHAKGVRHETTTEGSTIKSWTEAMYETVYENWPGARQALQTHAMVGSFKRYGMFKTSGNHRWHYSGTFYWFRNRDVFSRNWERIDQSFFGTESWPGLMFRPEETACLFFDHAGDLYDLNYWNTEVQPKLEAWRNES